MTKTFSDIRIHLIGISNFTNACTLSMLTKLGKFTLNP